MNAAVICKVCRFKALVHSVRLDLFGVCPMCESEDHFEENRVKHVWCEMAFWFPTASLLISRERRL